MHGKDVLEQLSDYVDAELDSETRESVRDHLESCASCLKAQTELGLLKRLVQTKVFRLPAPGGLVGRVFRNTRPPASSSAAARSSSRWRRPGVVTGLAATVLLGALGVLTVVILRGVDSPRAHAVAVREVAHQFRDMARGGDMARSNGTDAGNRGPSADVQKHDQLILSEIRDRTGVTLNHIPRIPDARLIRWETTTILGRQGIRLDYHDIDTRLGRRPTTGSRVIRRTVFRKTLVRRKRAGLLRSSPCRFRKSSRLGVLFATLNRFTSASVSKSNGLTILCFRDNSTTFHLTTWDSKMQDRLGLNRAVGEHRHDSHDE